VIGERVSVIMPVRNEAAFIVRSLGAVLAQDYPPDRLEVIVADGQSTDGTREQVQALQGRHPNLHLIDNPGRIVPTGLNAALRVARGDIIIRVDGHCEIAPDYVRNCVAHLKAGQAECVGGPIETIGEGPTAQAIAIAMGSPFGVGNSAFRVGHNRDRYVDTVAFPAYTRALLEQTGPFDEELVRNQDDEHNYRLRAMGNRILLAPDVRARYYSRASLRSLCRQYFQYGFWKVRVLQKHPRQMQPRQFVPPAFVAALLTSALLAPFFHWSRWALALTGGAYLAANVTAAVYAAARHGWRHLPLLPLVFAALHLSYGLGFLAGLVRFWNRWRDRRGQVPANFAQQPGIAGG
jgi:succinoglycan biosynthesis protein ExoA